MHMYHASKGSTFFVGTTHNIISKEKLINKKLVPKLEFQQEDQRAALPLPRLLPLQFHILFMELGTSKEKNEGKLNMCAYSRMGRYLCTFLDNFCSLLVPKLNNITFKNANPHM